MPSASSAFSRALDNRNVLGLVFMLPAAALLLLFLTYPLGLGLWLGLTDQKIDGTGGFLGVGHFVRSAHDGVFLLSIFTTLLYTVAAIIIKFGLGLHLPLLPNT